MNDPLFGIHARALDLRAQRGELLASNLANAETPHFKARDIDFAAALEEAGGNVDVARTQSGHLGSVEGAGNAQTLYRMPHQPSLDGNTVEADVEQSAFAENSMQYMASLRFISGRIEAMRLAITGGR